jgi:hypothetical protein
MSIPKYTRPALDEALAAWKDCLSRHGLPTEMIWIFSENLCIERSRTAHGNFRYGFQTRFARPDDDALDIAYDFFCDTDARVVFYRLGTSGGKSVCMLLCDRWFEEKRPVDGYEPQDHWKISFRPGHDGEIEEITDLARWVRRVRHDQSLHDFDFCMTLEAVDEIRNHGRPLLHYERMAQRMLGRLRRMFGQE